MPFPGEVLAGKYRVDAEIGRGGMGVVYRATHLVTRGQVAIKWLLPDARGAEVARQRLIREARTASTISDPNIVDVFDVVDAGSSAFLVMELLEGELLSERLGRERMSVSAILELLLPAMRAVARAHAGGIIHRDLKPDNLFICRRADGSELLKVLDFGISKFVAPEAEELAITRSGATVGSPHYMPLEQLQGAKDLDGRTDVYAFGVILYEALTGQKPFKGASYGEIAVRVATHTPELPRLLRPDIPPMLERAVLGALARDRHARHPDMGRLIHAIELSLHPERDVLGATAPIGVPTLAPSPTGFSEVEAAPLDAKSAAREPAAHADATRTYASRRAVYLVLGVVAAAGLSAWWWRPTPAADPPRQVPVPRVVPHGAVGLPELVVAPALAPPAPAPIPRRSPASASTRVRPTPVAIPASPAAEPPASEPPQLPTPSPRRAGPMSADDF